MPRVTLEWKVAEVLFDARGRAAIDEALALSAKCASEGYEPAARYWREVSAICEARLALLGSRPSRQVASPSPRL